MGTGLLAFYVTVQFGDFWGWDGRTMANVAHNILDHRTLRVTPDVSWYVKEFPGDTSPFGIGMSVLLVPLWAIQRAVDPHHGYWLTLANPVITAATATVVYHIGLALGWRRVSAVVAALSFGLLTMAPMYSTELFNEPAVALCLAVALLGLLRMSEGRAGGPWMLGASVGVASIFRYESFLLVVPLVAAALFFAGRERLRQSLRRWVLPLLGPASAAAAWTLWYNHYRFGSPLTFSPGGPFSTPVLDGVYRQLLSPGKGFFWYDPILVAALPGVWLLWRRNRGVAVVIAALFMARVAFFARYFNPDGSVAWGPRYLAPLCPLLALGVGEVVERTSAMRRRVRAIVRSVLVVLALLGSAATVASLWVPYTYTWAVANDIRGWQEMPVELLAEMKQRRYARQYDDWRWSPIVLNLRSLDDASRYSPFPLRWWRGGPHPIGVATLTVALAGVTGAAVVAAAGDRREGKISRSPSSSSEYLLSSRPLARFATMAYAERHDRPDLEASSFVGCRAGLGCTSPATQREKCKPEGG